MRELKGSEMQAKDFSPRAEPIAWGMIAGLVIAAAASYGLGVTPELESLIVYLAPMIGGALWARSRAWAPDSVATALRDQRSGEISG
jgi:hypothetical protein